MIISHSNFLDESLILIVNNNLSFANVLDNHIHIIYMHFSLHLLDAILLL